ncbi:hypothetical protein BHM03_00037791, partial [Ensete ventricosum]
KVEFRLVFPAPSQKFKILAFPSVLAHEKSYELGFVKKHDDHKLCTKSHGKSSFDRFFVHRLRNSNTGHSQHIRPWEVVRARFHEKT